MMGLGEELLTVSEAAQILRVTPHTVYRWIAAGRLPAVRYSRRVLRIRRSDLEAVGATWAVVREARSPYRVKDAGVMAVETEEQEEIKRFFERYERLRRRPRPPDDPPRGSWEALRRTIGIISEEAGEQLSRLVMEDREASRNDPH